MTGPLTGRRIVNTRAAHQSASLDRLLEAAGAISLSYPCVAIMAPDTWDTFDRYWGSALRGGYRWLVFASENAVDALAGRLESRFSNVAIPAGVQVAAIGSSTASAVLERLGRRPDFVPSRANATTLADELPARQGDGVLAPGSQIARAELRDGLERRAIHCESVAVYQTVIGTGGVDLPELLANEEVDAIAATSPSAIDGLMTRLASAGVGIESIDLIPVVCIGATTAGEAMRRGLRVIEAREQSAVGIVTRLAGLFVPVGSGGNR